MDEKKHDVFGLMNMLIIISGGIGAFLYLSDGVQGVATKEFHESDLEAKHQQISEEFYEQQQILLESMSDIRLNTLPPRIRPLLESKQEACLRGEEFSPEVDMLLQDLLHDYAELAGREWNDGTCIEGTWIE